jgi:hypothetical protein
MRSDDLYFALITNVLLTTCFSMGIILVGDDSYEASLLMVIFVFSVLIISLALILVIIYTFTTYPQIRLAESCQKPNFELKMEAGCAFHAFSSHVWKTGQDRTHAIVRKLQLLMSDVKIWLDVDEIDKSGGDLENAVEDSVVFLLVYSRGYFQSKNCRHELNTALDLAKPIIMIYKEDVESTEPVLEIMKKEYEEFCFHDETTSSRMLGYFDNAIPWLNEDVYSAKALSFISHCLLSHLPHYQIHPKELGRGVSVPGEADSSVRVVSPINMCVCSANEGALSIAQEAKMLLGTGSSADFVTIVDPLECVDDLNPYENDANTYNFEGTRTVLLLYLNKKIFQEKEVECCNIVKHCIEAGIDIIFAHELDPEKGGCPFDLFFSSNTTRAA